MSAHADDSTETAPRRFRPGLAPRVLGWAILVGFGGGVVALLGHVVLHHAQLPAEELWSALWTGLFFALLALLGAAVQRSYFTLGRDTIDVVRPYGTKRFRVADLAGFGTIVIVVNMVPMLHIRLYRAGPVEIAKLPVSFADRAEVERWFAQRLPRVDDPGSILRPQPRFRNNGNG